MGLWYFVSDLHGDLSRYQKLFKLISSEKPEIVLMGGDLLPAGYTSLDESPGNSFINSVLLNEFTTLKIELTTSYPKVLLILGNDDPRAAEAELAEGEAQGLWNYIHLRKMNCGDFTVFGYACVPPTPFMLKDWERYDVSRFVDLGCIPPEEGWRSVPMPQNEIKFGTILADLDLLTNDTDLSRSIFLFHAPPHQTNLDRLAVDGKTIDNIPLDKNGGSIAIRRFIEKKQPHITLHGHIHESARITGSWREQLGHTWSFSAAHDGVELALVRFDPKKPENATRSLI